jgi:Ran GTPase-activating protein (RanGAP) involved in mRNA processing and transport
MPSPEGRKYPRAVRLFSTSEGGAVLKNRKTTKTPKHAPACERPASHEIEIDIDHVDASLLDKMNAVPHPASMLGKVDEWIRDLERKLRQVDVDTSQGVDQVVAMTGVRRYVSDIPFPDWSGAEKQPVILPEISPTKPRAPTPVYIDYAPVLHMADQEEEDDDADNRDAGARLVRQYNDKCGVAKIKSLPQVVSALERRQAQSLDVARCSIACGGLTALSPFLGQLVGLVSLNLAGNMLLDDGATSLAKALKSTRTLATLMLDDNKIGSLGSGALAEQLQSKKCCLTALSVRNNKLSDVAIATIVNALSCRNKIVRLILAHNAVGQQSCIALAHLLKTSRNLEYLDCHWGHMRHDGAEEFALALQSAEKLTHLDLGW